MTNEDDAVIYDDNGNMWGRNGRTIAYDYDNRATSIAGPSGTVTSVYDYSGHRVKKIGTSGTTIYIGKLYECTNGICTKYIFAGSTRIAQKDVSNPSKIYYYHTDHLGSSGVITDASGNKAQETYYYPFGAARYNSGTVTDYKYTGQELDDETKLYYYGARYYDPVIGRFISPDSIVQAPEDPQTLNRFSYVVNNPLLYTDPTGHLFGLDDLLIGALIGSIIGGTTSAVTGGDILQGVVLGAISGAFFGAANGIISGGAYFDVCGGGMYNTFTAGEQAAIYAAAGTGAGATNAAIAGANIGQGALIGGIAGGLGSFGSPNINLFGDSAAGSIGNRLFNSAVTGAVFGGAYAGVTGGNIGQGAAYGAMGWAAGEAANMLIGHGLGYAMSGKGPSKFEDGVFYYHVANKGPFTVGGVIIGDEDWLSRPNLVSQADDPWHSVDAHERSHIRIQQTPLSVSYIPVHLVSQGISWLLSGSTHRYNIFERGWIDVPSY